MKRKKTIWIILVVVLLVAAMLLVNCRDTLRLNRVINDYQTILNHEVPEYLTLTIYYLPYYILTRTPLTVEDLVGMEETVKIVVDSDELARQISTLKKLNASALQPAGEKYDLNARLYYVFQTGDSDKLLEVTMQQLEGDTAAVGAFVNTIAVDKSAILYEVLLPFLTEEDCENLGIGDGVCVIPDTLDGEPVTAISEGAFYQNAQYTQIILPQTLQSIDSGAFYRCSALREIRIPKGVKSIAGNPFFRAGSLENIWVEEENMNYCDIDGVLFTKDSKTMLAYPEGRKDTQYAIPEGVTAIAGDAFGYDTALCYLFVPDSVVSFPDYNMFVYPDEITILASENSAAKAYAQKYNLHWLAEMP